MIMGPIKKDKKINNKPPNRLVWGTKERKEK